MSNEIDMCYYCNKKLRKFPTYSSFLDFESGMVISVLCHTSCSNKRS